MQRLILKFTLALALFTCSNNAFSQLTAPGRNWAHTTQYIYSAENQDSIFVFYANTGTLQANHPSGLISTFKWYKYNPNITNPSNRFELINTVNDETTSELNSLSEGGYRVLITDSAFDTDTFTVWLFTDNVVLNRIDSDNRCDFLELIAVTTPSSYDIENDRFVYFDLSRTSTQPEVNTYGRGYFQTIDWEASESRVEFSPSSALRQTIVNPAPLYNSSYEVIITNVFGREMSAQTTEITAIAAKAIQKVQADTDGSWVDYDSNTEYEALLDLRVESSSVNADSIYWRLSKLKTSAYTDEYNIIWRDSSIFTTRTEAFPPKRLMKPGFFMVKHLVVNTTSGCKDSVEFEVVVDSAKISPNAIPNVFTPNGSINKMFRFVEPEKNIKSIKSFTIRILSRSGRLIYEYSGDPKEWDGWDGNIKGTGAEAAEGVYYFIIEAKGWDGAEFDYGPYKGFLHLFRGKK